MTPDPSSQTTQSGADRDRYVTVVSGLPRSGTSLMMAMLEAGGIPALTDHLRAPDPDNTRGYYEFEPVKALRRDASWVGRARGKTVKVIHALLDALPDGFEYRVVFMRRDLREVVASQATMLARSARKGGRITEDQLRTLYAREYERVERWLGERQNMRVLFVDYNALVRDPAKGAATLNRFFDSRLDEAAMTGTVDPALYRQRAPGD